MSNLVLDSVSQYVFDALDQQGLGIDRSAELTRPEMPDDITQISDEDLMLLYTRFSAYTDFVNTQLSCALVDEKELERQVNYEESSALIRHHGSNAKMTVTMAMAMVDVDPGIVALKQRHMEKYAYRKILETMSSNYERGSAICSRELTRRTAGDNYKTRTRKFVT